MSGNGAAQSGYSLERICERFNVEWVVWCQFGGNGARVGVVCDLGLGGAGLTFGGPLPSQPFFNQPVVLKIQENEQRDAMELGGKIRWITNNGEDSARMGIQFSTVTMELLGAYGGLRNNSDGPAL